MVAATLAIAPLVVALVALRWRPWAPVLDLAMTEFRVRDVGGRTTPLIGLPGRIGDFPDQGSHPGPWSFYLVAPFYRLGGATAWGMQFGSVAINSAAFVGVVAIGRRLAGRTGAVVMAAVVAVAIRGYGLNVLTHPWNPYFPLALWLLLLVAAWAVVAGHHRLAVVVAVCGTVAAQTHVPYLVSAVFVSLIVLGSLVVRWRHADGEDRTAVRRSTLIALGTTVVLWLPPIIDQLRRDPGNMTMLFDHFTGEPDEPVVSLSLAGRVFLRHLDAFGMAAALIGRSNGFVVRSSEPYAGVGGSSVGGAIVLVAWVVAAVWAVRRGHRRLTALNVVLAAALLAAIVSVSRIFGKVWFYLTLWAWGTLLLVLVSIAWTAWLATRERVGREKRSLPERLPMSIAVAVGTVATLLSLGAVATHDVPEPMLSDGLRAVVPDTVAAIEAGVGDATGRDGRYLVRWRDAVIIGSQGYGLVNELERRGLDVGVQDPWRVPVTPHRVMAPGTFDAEIHFVSGVFVDEWSERPGFVEVAAADIRSDAEQARFADLRERVGVRLVELGRPELIDVVDRNLFGASLDPALPRDVVDDLSEMLDLGERVAVFIGPPGST